MLDAEEVHKLKQMMLHTGWQDVMAPKLEKRAKQLIDILLMAQSERPEPYKNIPDDIIRGEVRGIEWLRHSFSNEVVVHDYNRALDELDRQPEPVANPQG